MTEPTSAAPLPLQYNSQAIIQTAEQKFHEYGISAAQNVYQSALLDWVDDVTMGDSALVDMETVRGEIANLWLAYANLNRRSNLVSFNFY